MKESCHSGTLSPRKLFFLQVALIMVLYHSKGKVNDTVCSVHLQTSNLKKENCRDSLVKIPGKPTVIAVHAVKAVGVRADAAS